MEQNDADRRHMDVKLSDSRARYKAVVLAPGPNLTFQRVKTRRLRT